LQNQHEDFLQGDIQSIMWKDHPVLGLFVSLRCLFSAKFNIKFHLVVNAIGTIYDFLDNSLCINSHLDWVMIFFCDLQDQKQGHVNPEACYPVNRVHLVK